ncbi:MAG: hypothetical protein E5W19_15275 [Mesorhizobium sp.]|nr:MAG: hypothetical protein E5W19_15275 [Mesorhizobium sp.]
MLNLWEETSASALIIADTIRDLASAPIECEDDAEEIGRALQAAAAAISAKAASLIRLNDHPMMRLGRCAPPFGRRSIFGEP